MIQFSIRSLADLNLLNFICDLLSSASKKTQHDEVSLNASGSHNLALPTRQIPALSLEKILIAQTNFSE